MFDYIKYIFSGYKKTVLFHASVDFGIRGRQTSGTINSSATRQTHDMSWLSWKGGPPTRKTSH